MVLRPRNHIITSVGERRDIPVQPLKSDVFVMLTRRDMSVNTGCCMLVNTHTHTHSLKNNLIMYFT